MAALPSDDVTGELTEEVDPEDLPF